MESSYALEVIGAAIERCKGWVKRHEQAIEALHEKLETECEEIDELKARLEELYLAQRLLGGEDEQDT
jgi:predicted RNase H-like nuclease (RuvC/YqgF family)